ncbi:hypothetical protein CI088_11890 [Enterococcus plantarum]|uniref:DNA-directed RNA polymerase beta subunit n=1 Tax=Enterococcus plantarum TaxID=1077675 RepID=A0A2W3YV32_9ENTE|nr:hypothetical protein [Enterococcus plantarum]PZL71696.1 hypothetical protein CI088_11890 [Enterococcus plantarum]
MTDHIDLSDPYFREYEDRGMKKWQGFFLAEHTASVSRENKRLRKVVPQRRKMTEGEIGQICEFAFKNDRQVTVQLEIKDTEGKYFDDTIGFIEGFDELGYIINDTKVHYDEIRNVELFDFRKWNSI